MTNFTITLMNRDGAIPQIGDNDSGRVFQILPSQKIDNRAFVNLVYSLCLNKIKYNTAFNNENILFIDNSEFEETTSFDEFFFEHAKISVKNFGDFKLFFTAMDVERNRMGAHAHNDLLSFELWCQDEPMIVDLGTGSYTGNTKLRNFLRSTGNHSCVCVDCKEQREFHESNVFKFKNINNLSTKIYHKEKFIYGELYNQKELLQRRSVSYDVGKLRIDDEQLGEFKQLSCSLCLAPDVTIIETKTGVKLKKGNVLFNIEGTWEFSVADTLYSPGYDLLCQTKKIVLKSNQARNTLTFFINRQEY